jgi:hypothetical protein
VRQLASLLSEEGLSDASYSKASSSVRTLVDVAPVHLSTILVSGVWHHVLTMLLQSSLYNQE